MYGLEDIKRFAFPWLREELDALTAGDEARKIKALGILATTWWRWTAPAVRDLLRGSASPLFTEHLLHALYALDPRMAVSTAWELHAAGVHPEAAVAAMFLNLLPPRLRGDSGEAVVPLDHLPDADLLPHLSSRLGAPDPRIGFAATRAIAKSGDLTHLSPLFDTLRDPSPAVVHGCLTAIKSLAPRQAVHAGEVAFDRADNHACKAVAAEWLLQLGEEGMAALEAIPMTDPERRQAHGRALIRWRPNEAMALLRQWAKSTDRDTRNLAVNLLYEVVAIESGFADRESEQRIDDCRDISIPLLSDTNDYARSTALVVLAESGWPEWPRHALRMLEGTTIVRLEAIGLLDDKRALVAESDVVRLMMYSSDLVRQRAFLLAQRLLEPSRLLEVIREMATSSIPDLRRAAIGMLTRLNTLDGYPILECLLQDAVAEVRCEALSASAALAPDRTSWLAHALHACSDTSPIVRQRALDLLGDHGDSGSLDRITSLLTDPESDVRRAALQATANLAPDQCDEFARQLMTDADGNVARAAIDILRSQLADSELAEVAVERLRRAQGESGEILLDIAVQTAPDLVEQALAEAMKSRVDAVRRRAAEILGEGVSGDDG